MRRRVVVWLDAPEILEGFSGWRYALRHIRGHERAKETGGIPVGSQFRREHVVWLLGSLCQLQRIPFDPALIESVPGSGTTIKVSVCRTQTPGLQ